MCACMYSFIDEKNCKLMDKSFIAGILESLHRKQHVYSTDESFSIPYINEYTRLLIAEHF